jgi:hypothetical protein
VTLNWGALATEMLGAFPVAIVVWIAATWLWRKFGAPPGLG